MLRDLLSMNDVQIASVVRTSDGMGGIAESTSLTTLVSAIIYQNGSNKSFLSDRISAKSSDVLITEPGFHNWTQADQQVIRGNCVYNVVGIPDDVMGSGEIIVVGLERII